MQINIGIWKRKSNTTFEKIFDGERYLFYRKLFWKMDNTIKRPKFGYEP